MVREEKCWRCGRLGIAGDKCSGCGATVSAIAPNELTTENAPEYMKAERLEESRAAKPASRQPGVKKDSDVRSSVRSNGESDLSLLKEIAVNTASTAKAVGLIAKAALYLIVGGFFSILLFNLGLIQVQTCNQESCSPDWFLIMAGVILGLVGVLSAVMTLNKASNQRTTR